MWYKCGMNTTTIVAREPRLLARLGLILAMAMGVLWGAPNVCVAQEFEELAVVFNPLTSRSVESAKVTLGLDKDQTDAAKELYVGYRSAMKGAVKELEAKSKALMEKVQESGDWESMRKDQMKLMREAFDKVGTFETRFNDDLKAVLTPEQVEKFPAFERARRRENVRLIQIMAGEAADLIDVLGTLKIDTSKNEELKNAMAEYEVSLDRIVAERLTMLKEFVNKMTDASADEGSMMTLMTDSMPKIYAKAKSARDLNKQVTRRVAELLAEADREKFLVEVNRRSHPRVYRTTATGKKFEAAKKFEDISENQKGTLETLHANYLRDAGAANRAWADAIEAAQEEFGGDFSMMMSGEEGPAAAKASEAYEKRSQVEKQFIERLEQLLSKEQVERLPAARAEDEVEEVDVNEPDFDKDAIKDWKDEAE
jgi:hypothetical protein